MDKYWHIIQALCKTGKATKSNAVIRQIERLAIELKENGDSEYSEQLYQILEPCNEQPMKIVKSKES